MASPADSSPSRATFGDLTNGHADFNPFLTPNHAKSCFANMFDAYATSCDAMQVDCDTPTLDPAAAPAPLLFCSSAPFCPLSPPSPQVVYGIAPTPGGPSTPASLLTGSALRAHNAHQIDQLMAIGVDQAELAFDTDGYIFPRFPYIDFHSLTPAPAAGADEQLSISAAPGCASPSAPRAADADACFSFSPPAVADEQPAVSATPNCRPATTPHAAAAAADFTFATPAPVAPATPFDYFVDALDLDSLFGGDDLSPLSHPLLDPIDWDGMFEDFDYIAELLVGEAAAAHTDPTTAAAPADATDAPTPALPAAAPHATPAPEVIDLTADCPTPVAARTRSKRRAQAEADEPVAKRTRSAAAAATTTTKRRTTKRTVQK